MTISRRPAGDPRDALAIRLPDLGHSRPRSTAPAHPAAAERPGCGRGAHARGPRLRPRRGATHQAAGEQVPLVPLERDRVVRPLRRDGPGDGGLAADGVDGHDAAAPAAPGSRSAPRPPPPGLAPAGCYSPVRRVPRWRGLTRRPSRRWCAAPAAATLTRPQPEIVGPDLHEAQASVERTPGQSVGSRAIRTSSLGPAGSTPERAGERLETTSLESTATARPRRQPARR